MSEKMDDLRTRVTKFNLMKLPGQVQMMHMGTAYLISDLWYEVQKLHAELKKSKEDKH